MISRLETYLVTEATCYFQTIAELGSAISWSFELSTKWEGTYLALIHKSDREQKGLSLTFRSIQAN